MSCLRVYGICTLAGYQRGKLNQMYDGRIVVIAFECPSQSLTLATKLAKRRDRRSNFISSGGYQRSSCRRRSIVFSQTHAVEEAHEC